MRGGGGGGGGGGVGAKKTKQNGHSFIVSAGLKSEDYIRIR